MIIKILCLLLVSVVSLNLKAQSSLFVSNQSNVEEDKPISEPVRTYPLPTVKPNYRIDIVSIFRSKKANNENVEIYMSNKGHDPYACEKTKINHKFSLDKKDKRNSSFLSRARINRWYSVGLACSDQPMNTFEKAKSSDYTYLKNCYILEFKSSKRPPDTSECYSNK